MKKLYFAYGMNLNHEHMRLSCPTARAIGPAKIDGYRLVFRYYADIVKSDPAHSVWGGCWEIDEDAEFMLDRIEVYPVLYDKIEIDGMLTYQMIERREIELPSPEYVLMVTTGLSDFGLPIETLQRNIKGDHNGYDYNK